MSTKTSLNDKHAEDDHIMSTLWAVPASAGLRPHHILAFLTDARCSVRVVEVRLFGSDSFYNRAPIACRRWEPSGNLADTANEILGIHC